MEVGDFMRKKIINIFPGLETHMLYRLHDYRKLASILDISHESVLKRLSGEVEFELSEIKKLMREYRTSFDNLFDTEYKEVIYINDREGF